MRGLLDLQVITGPLRMTFPLLDSVVTERRHCFARRKNLWLAQREHRALHMHMQLLECTITYKVVDGGERLRDVSPDMRG